MPTYALGSQILISGRCLGPADGVGSHGDQIRDVVLDVVLMKAHNELHIFAEPFAIAAGTDDCVFAEHAKGTGNNEHVVAFIFGEAVGEEGSQVFDDLDLFDHCFWYMGLDNDAALHLAAVGDADDAADSDGFGATSKMAGDVFEGFGFEHAVGVDAADEWKAAEINSGVEGVGFAAVFFVNKDDFMAIQIGVDVTDGFAGQGLGKSQG